ncbi:unnamed protein product [Vicia faba]|uniref:Helicase ATP-binding domain-containing protein n=1 Tax=Vicia faba TaxID=3906 RepID=A0AAV0ZWE3_VICFA|nr:unnamed protein product [Vicia faba]
MSCPVSIHTAATILDRNHLVKYDRKTGYFQATDSGRIASYYYITHGTISTYNEHLKASMGDIELFQLFSLSEEFKYITVRQDEKMELARLLDRVPIPIKESSEDASAKINVLLQSYISQLKLEGLSLTSDMVFISQSAERLLRALFEIVLKHGWAQLAEKALNLCKMVTKRMWSAQTPLRQFNGIPNGILTKLEKKNLSWESKCSSNFSLSFGVELTITPDFSWDDRIHGYVEQFWVAWTPIVLPVSFRHIILSEKYPPPTKLLDLQSLPVTALQSPSYEVLYQNFKHFNPIQTQVFSVLYNSDDSVLVAAPTGSGKTICAEFAILRNHQKGPDSVMCVVYVAPIEALAKEQYVDWEKKFGGGLKLKVVELTGETTTDLKLLENGQIIICTPEKWDALSRRWQHRKHVQQVSLFIVDELHLIGGQGGPILEVIVSRMKYIASQVENKIRFVALSTSLANAKDLGDWIGAISHGLFNFPLGVRPGLEIYIQGVDIANFEARMQAMTKRTYTAIAQYAKNEKPALVFVPTKKHVRLTAMDLITYSNAGTGEKSFLLRSTEELEPFLNKISEKMLKVTLREGVGYLHEGLNNLDHDIVAQLFEAGWIQVCVLSSSMCYKVTLSAHLMVVMGTQYYHGRENAQTDYPVTDIPQMMGHASRHSVDNSGKCVIFCWAPRKEYYKKFLYEAFPAPHPESKLLQFTRS